jgi:hypothetical protein
LNRKAQNLPGAILPPFSAFKAYTYGAFNASLFATEGIASVGLTLAPLSALVCGLAIAVSNRLSSGLPPRFVLLLGGVLPDIFPEHAILYD